MRGQTGPEPQAPVGASRAGSEAAAAGPRAAADDRDPLSRPLYVVTFGGREEMVPESPVLFGPHQNVGGPHLLAPDVATAIPALWYSLHLPRDVFDVVDAPARLLKFFAEVGNPVQVLFLPLAWLTEETIAFSPFAGCERMRIYCPDEDLDAANQRSIDLAFRFQAMPFSVLNDSRLQNDWQEIRAYWASLGMIDDEDIRADRLQLRSLSASNVTGLASDRTARQMGRPSPADVPADVRTALFVRAQADATGRLEQLGTSPAAAFEILRDEVTRTYHSQRLAVSAVLPGVPRAYARTLARSVRGAQTLVHTSVSAPEDVEDGAMAVIAAAGGVQAEALALVLPEVPEHAWVQLTQLERHWVDSARPNSIRKILGRLSDVTEELWTDQVLEALHHASSLQLATNFPLGLLTAPGDTSPLAFRLPIAYEPLVPLTRRLQHAFTRYPQVDLTRGFKVLVVECIPDTDPVGVLSRRGWDVAEEMFKTADGTEPATIHRREALNIQGLREALNEVQPDIAVISAHGFSDSRSNIAGIVVGDERFVGVGLDYLPPAVLLSACHVSPRGTGQVSVVDLLLQQGVLAVLGTQVPVDVRRNATLMLRLFVYLRESLARAEPEASLLEVWHRTLGGNPINDVLHGNKRLAEWAVQPTGDDVVLTHFMLRASVGRLRKGHVYLDTEQVLLDIAEEMGMSDNVRAWLRAPGYVPESAMYAFYGRPDLIRLATHPQF